VILGFCGNPYQEFGCVAVEKVSNISEECTASIFRVGGGFVVVNVHAATKGKEGGLKDSLYEELKFVVEVDQLHG
jgi:hypothetical protein